MRQNAELFYKMPNDDVQSAATDRSTKPQGAIAARLQHIVRRPGSSAVFGEWPTIAHLASGHHTARRKWRQ